MQQVVVDWDANLQYGSSSSSSARNLVHQVISDTAGCSHLAV
jgi:hypothetical protein